MLTALSDVEGLQQNEMQKRTGPRRLMFLPHLQAGQPALRLAGLPVYGAKTPTGDT